MFGKVEFFWCHVRKCASSPAEKALTFTLTGLYTGENQELVVPCRLEVLYLLPCCKCCCDSFVHMLQKHHGRISDYLFIEPVFQPESFCDKEHACVTSVEAMNLSAVLNYSCNINRAPGS